MEVVKRIPASSGGARADGSDTTTHRKRRQDKKEAKSAGEPKDERAWPPSTRDLISQITGPYRDVTAFMQLRKRMTRQDFDQAANEANIQDSLARAVVWKFLDSNGDGYLTKAELRQKLEGFFDHPNLKQRPQAVLETDTDKEDVCCCQGFQSANQKIDELAKGLNGYSADRPGSVCIFVKACTSAEVTQLQQQLYGTVKALQNEKTGKSFEGVGEYKKTRNIQGDISAFADATDPMECQAVQTSLVVAHNEVSGTKEDFDTYTKTQRALANLSGVSKMTQHVYEKEFSGDVYEKAKESQGVFQETLAKLSKHFSTLVPASRKFLKDVTELNQEAAEKLEDAWHPPGEYTEHVLSGTKVSVPRSITSGEEQDSS